MAEAVQFPFNLDNTLGALLIGGLLAAAFWGVTSAQTYIYYQRYPNDPLPLKSIVAFLWVLDTFDACLTSHILYHYLVTNYLNPLAIAIPVWSVIIHVAVTSVTDAIIRSMFTRRVWRLSGQNTVLTSIVGAVTLCDLLVGLAITVNGFGLQSYAQLDELSTMFYVNFGAGVLGDCLVAIILCYYLFTSRTGFRSTDTLVNTLIAYIVTTGLFTSVVAILGTVFYVMMPTNFIFIAFYFNLAKMYLNSYLALLNARQHLREKSDGAVSFRLSRLSDQHYTADFGTMQSLSSRLDKLPQRDIEVCIQTTVDRKSERELAH